VSTPHRPVRLLRPLPRFEPPPQGRTLRHRPHTVRRGTPHDGRSGRTTPIRASGTGDAGGATAAERAAEADALRFADRTIRLVLEVVDGRRPGAQLTGMVAPPLLTTLTATRSPANTSGSAALIRLRVRTVDDRHAELFGTYTRGTRVLAVAGRVTRPSANPRTRGRPVAPHGWLLTSVWLG